MPAITVCNWLLAACLLVGSNLVTGAMLWWHPGAPIVQRLIVSLPAADERREVRDGGQVCYRPHWAKLPQVHDLGKATGRWRASLRPDDAPLARRLTEPSRMHPAVVPRSSILRPAIAGEGLRRVASRALPLVRSWGFMHPATASDQWAATAAESVAT